MLTSGMSLRLASWAVAELAASGAEGFGAVSAGADAAEVVVAVDAGGMAVGESDLDGVVANLSGSFGAGLGLEHRQRRRGSCPRGGKTELLDPLVIASGPGALVAKIREIVMTGVTVGPGNVDAGAAGYMDFYRGWLFAGIDRDGHCASANVNPCTYRCSNRQAG